MRKIFKRKPIKAIFETTVDFNQDCQKQNGNFERGRSYFLDKFKNQERKTSYDEVKEYLTETIENDLKKHLNKTLDLQISEIQITTNYEGSIELIFVVLFNAYQFLSGLPDFIGSLKMIERHSQKFLRKKLNDKYGDVFTVNTSIESPSLQRYYPEDFFHHFFMKGRGIPLPFDNREHPQRDGFFYYLLFSNIALIIIILLLIYKAVTTFYLK